MKNMTPLLVAVLAVCAQAICPSCAEPQSEAKPSQSGDQNPREKVKADVVTFHVIGMKKTASGAT